LALAIILISKKKLFYHLYERNRLQIETCTVKTMLLHNVAQQNVNVT
jgi:hypothetical protein